ncbi:LolA family protein [Angustibacter luteus]|uniref:Outer membrane lipoprotein carrier protein LolA n=1 Tax=Angustibacter luteus TaxID=658456 RepID=A0ABW1JAK4_9ACTN
MRPLSRHARWAVPVVAAGVVVGGVQLSAWASSTSSGLPTLTASELLVKAQQAKVDALSGTVRSTAKLGLPALPGQGGADWSSLVAGTQTLRVFADGPERQRVDLLGSLTQASIVHDERTVWTWASQTREVTKATLPTTAGAAQKSSGSAASSTPLTPQEAADQALQAITPTTDVSVGRSAKVAGRPAYDLRLVPRESASLVGSVDLYVDAATGLALRTVVTPRGSTEPAVDIGFTSLSLHAPAASTFRFTPPPGSTVRTVTVPQRSADRQQQVRPTDAPTGTTVGQGWTTVLVTSALPAASAVQDSASGDATGLSRALLAAARTVHGDFGTGKLLSTRLVSVLQTEDGRVFVGAVTPAELIRVAGATPTSATPVR